MTERDKYEVLLDAVFCVAAADGRVSKAELSTVVETFARIGAPLNNDDIRSALAGFAARVRESSLREVLNQTKANVTRPATSVNNRRAFFEVLRLVAEADGEILKKEQSVIDEFWEVVGAPDVSTNDVSAMGSQAEYAHASSRLHEVHEANLPAGSTVRVVQDRLTISMPSQVERALRVTRNSTNLLRFSRPGVRLCTACALLVIAAVMCNLVLVLFSYASGNVVFYGILLGANSIMLLVGGYSAPFLAARTTIFLDVAQFGVIWDMSLAASHNLTLSTRQVRSFQLTAVSTKNSEGVTHTDLFLTAAMLDGDQIQAFGFGSDSRANLAFARPIVDQLNFHLRKIRGSSGQGECATIGNIA